MNGKYCTNILNHIDIENTKKKALCILRFDLLASLKTNFTFLFDFIFLKVIF